MFLYQHHRLYRRKILIASFLLPVILMACYFAYRQMTPFGKSSLYGPAAVYIFAGYLSGCHAPQVGRASARRRAEDF